MTITDCATDRQRPLLDDVRFVSKVTTELEGGRVKRVNREGGRTGEYGGDDGRGVVGDGAEGGW